MNKTLKILFLEDFLPDVQINVANLRKENLEFQYRVVSTEQEFQQEVLNYQPDIVLSDFNLPQYTGLEALNFLKENHPDIPFIMVTGSLDEETAADCIKQGAWDYVIKGHIVRLGPAVKNALTRKEEIQQKEKAEEDKKASEIKFEQFAQMLPEVVCELDMEGNIIYVNEKAYEVFGYTHQQFQKGINIFEIIHPDDLERIRYNVRLLINHDNNDNQEYLIKKADGTFFTALIHANLIMKKSSPVGMRAVIVNISPQKKTEEIIRQREEELRLMIDNSPIAVCSTDLQGHFLTLNETFTKLLGYLSSELIGKHFNEITHPDDLQKNAVLYNQLINKQITHFDLEKRYIHKNGNIIYCRLRSQLVHDEKGKPIFEIAVVEDITEQTRILEELKRREAFNFALFQHNPIETIIVDKEGRITQSNLEVRRNRSRLPIKGTKMYIDYAGKHEKNMYKILMDCIHFGTTVHITESVYKDRVWSIKIAPFDDGAIITAIDITAQKEAEKKLRKSLNEKELLLREVHHRVKNNMQIVSSILKLQQHFTNNQEAFELLRKSYQRVRSMSMIHEKLYQNKDFEAIDFSEYVSNLIKIISSAYKEESAKLKIVNDIEHIFLNINIAIPCGLIVNELVTNCIKHAFPDEKLGTIHIAMQEQSPGQYEMKITDDGVGLPSDITPENPQTMGLQIVDSLSRQLKSKVEYCSEQGTCFKFNFRDDHVDLG